MRPKTGKFGGGYNSLTPNHLIIEGDNLVSLSALAYTHAGKIDVIYIDPPYNTGNKDFVYNDSFVDKEDAYRHSKWLSFMERRLRIAKKLLSDRGVIFISIGSDEVAQLVILCNELFGEKNQLGIVTRVQKKGNGKGMYFSPSVDYVLVYCKLRNSALGFHAPNTSKFPYLETSGDRAGEYFECSKSLYQSSLDSRPNQRYYIECPDHTYIIPPGNVFPNEINDGAYVKPLTNEDKCWRWSWDSYLKQKDLLVFKKVKKHTLINELGTPSCWNVYTKRYKSDAEEKGKVPPNFIDDCINSLGTSCLNEMAIDFSFPKPCELIKYLIQIGQFSADSTILDFFAGSGTTLHAVMQLNAEDGGHRQCILCTNNENGICENVTYERNKRVIQGYTKPNGEKVEGLHDNNLRYYRTEFVGRSRTPRNMQRLVELSTDMLCIKEDLYAEQTEFGGMRIVPRVFRYFAEGERKMLIIYREEYIEDIVRLIAKVETTAPIRVYVFSPCEDPASELFEPVAEKVEPVALPAAIYNTYKRILPKRRDRRVDTEADNAEGGADTETDNELGGLFETQDEA